MGCKETENRKKKQKIMKTKKAGWKRNRRKPKKRKRKRKITGYETQVTIWDKKKG